MLLLDTIPTLMIIKKRFRVSISGKPGTNEFRQKNAKQVEKYGETVDCGRKADPKRAANCTCSLEDFTCETRYQVQNSCLADGNVTNSICFWPYFGAVVAESEIVEPNSDVQVVDPGTDIVAL